MKTIQVKYQAVATASTVQDENLPPEFIHRPHSHPPIPDAVPPEAQRLQQLNDIWSVKQCPHCRSRYLE